jgi:formylmethanofuran dehydrogenase subunit B
MQVSNTSLLHHATCPACGLLCDDVRLENGQVKNTNCPKAIEFFEQKCHDGSPQIAGKNVTLTQAIAHAAKLLKQSKQPLFSGLSTDLQGFRGIYNLAQKSNAKLQHLNAASSQRNLNVLQSTGWQTTTLTEVKNRADVIVCIGGDIVSHNPRFFERVVAQDGMFIDAKQREIIFIGENINFKKHAPEGAWILGCRASDLAEITATLRALIAGKTLKAAEVAGVKVSDLQSVADKLKAAKYAVLTWVAKDFDFPHAELTIQNITQTVAILNETTRAGGLPLGGSDGDTTVTYANTWLSGLTLNNQTIAHDLLLWVNSFNAEKLPQTEDKPLIIIGNMSPLPNPLPQGAREQSAPDVFIPVATPGLDCNGTLFRVDSSVVLPLKKVRENNLPTLSEIASQIENLL